MKKIVFLILFIIVLTLLVFQCSDPVRPNEENNDTTIYQEIVSDNYIEGSMGWAILNDGSGQLANGNIVWDTIGNITIRGNITCLGVITGGIIQTAASGQRIAINGINNNILFYNEINEAIQLSNINDELYINGKFGVEGTARFLSSVVVYSLKIGNP